MVRRQELGVDLLSIYLVILSGAKDLKKILVVIHIFASEYSRMLECIKEGL